MLWNRIRYFGVVALWIGIASVGASGYLNGSQEPATKEAQPTGQPSEPKAAQGPQSKSSKDAKGQPAAGDLRVTLRAQQLATRRAKAHYEIARETSELALIAIEEYNDVTYPRELARVEADVKLAEAEQSRAKDRLDWANRMWEKGYVSKAGKVSEEENYKKARFTVEQAQARRYVLADYSKNKTIKDLQSDVEKTHLNEVEAKAVWDSARSKEAELERLLKYAAY